MGPEGTDTIVTQNPDWLKERPDIDRRLPSNQIQSCIEETSPQPVGLPEEVVTVKQEVDEEHVKMSSQQEGQSEPAGLSSVGLWSLVIHLTTCCSCPPDVLQSFTSEEGPQVTGRDIVLHVKEEEDRASGPVDNMTQSIDLLMDSTDDERRSSNQIQSLRVEDRVPSQSDSLRQDCEGTCVPSDHNRFSCSEDSGGAQLGAGLQSTLGSKTPGDQKILVNESLVHSGL